MFEVTGLHIWCFKKYNPYIYIHIPIGITEQVISCHNHNHKKQKQYISSVVSLSGNIVGMAPKRVTVTFFQEYVIF